MSCSSKPKELPDNDGDNRWMDMHNRFVAEAREAEPDVLWVGDSLIQNLVNSHIWERHFCQMHSLNFGIGGNRTEHVLWRLQNGELDVLSPKVRNYFKDLETGFEVEFLTGHCVTGGHQQPW